MARRIKKSTRTKMRNQRRAKGSRINRRKYKDNPNYKLMNVKTKDGKIVRRYVKIDKQGNVIDKRYKPIGAVPTQSQTKIIPARDKTIGDKTIKIPGRRTQVTKIIAKKGDKPLKDVPKTPRTIKSFRDKHDLGAKVRETSKDLKTRDSIIEELGIDPLDQNGFNEVVARKNLIISKYGEDTYNRMLLWGYQNQPNLGEYYRPFNDKIANGLEYKSFGPIDESFKGLLKANIDKNGYVTLYRGGSAADNKVFGGFSYSLDPQISKTFAESLDDGIVVQIKVKADNLTPIGFFGASSEAEVLVPVGTSFEISDIWKKI